VSSVFQTSLIASKMAENKRYDAITTLGIVICGATPHFDYVCNEGAKGITNAALKSEKPVIFGILTTETIEQAVERAGTKAGNKGSESAVAAIEMANMIKTLEG